MGDIVVAFVSADSDCGEVEVEASLLFVDDFSKDVGIFLRKTIDRV